MRVCAFLSEMVNTETFRTSLKTVGKNSENMSSKICTLITIKTIKTQYELYRVFTDLKEQRQMH